MHNDFLEAEKQWLDPDNDPRYEHEDEEDYDYQAEDEAEDEVLGNEY